MNLKEIKRAVETTDEGLRSFHSEVYFGLLESVVSSLNSYEWSAEILPLIWERDFAGLVVRADYLAGQQYASAAENFAANQVASLVRKYTGERLDGVDPRQAAISTFHKAEHRCKRMNQKFRALATRNPRSDLLHFMSGWISHVLGDFSYEAVMRECNFGPGASIGVHGDRTNEARKLLSDSWSSTPGARDLGFAAFSRDPHILELLSPKGDGGLVCWDRDEAEAAYLARCTLVKNNKIAFVPKTVKTDRSIAVEPLINTYLQKGVDVVLRRRLLRVGIDLSDQERNRNLSRDGSLNYSESDCFCTIDLSSASDSVSIGLCKALLPPDWFYYLDRIRSHEYELDGTVVPYHKFCSMGNGFCFPLETLIFASVCAEAYAFYRIPFDFSVYGDDIIVRRPVFQRVMASLHFLGFIPNTKKTFSEGPFRESCGADWYGGKDVRPLILDAPLDSLQEVIKFWNLSLSKPSWQYFFEEARAFLRSVIPDEAFICRPYKGTVDSAFEVEMDCFMSSQFAHRSRNLFSWRWIELVTEAVPDREIADARGYPTVVMRAALRGVKSRAPFTVRRQTRTRVRWQAYAGATATWLPPT